MEGGYERAVMIYASAEMLLVGFALDKLDLAIQRALELSRSGLRPNPHTKRLGNPIIMPDECHRLLRQTWLHRAINLEILPRSR